MLDITETAADESWPETLSTLLKNAHLLRFPHPSSVWQKSLLIRRDATLRTSGALHLAIFEQRAENYFFGKLLTSQTL
jgi:hypothetical protein